MPTRNPVRWEIPTGLSFDLADLGSRSEEDFHPETLKGHIELLMFRALKAVSGRVDKTHVPPEEFRQLLEAEFQSMSEIHPPSIQQVVEEESKVFSEEGWKRLKEERCGMVSSITVENTRVGNRWDLHPRPQIGPRWRIRSFTSRYFIVRRYLVV